MPKNARDINLLSAFHSQYKRLQETLSMHERSNEVCYQPQN